MRRCSKQLLRYRVPRAPRSLTASSRSSGSRIESASTIVDVELNDVNGGSFSVWCRKRAAGPPRARPCSGMLGGGTGKRLDTLEPVSAFANGLQPRGRNCSTPALGLEPKENCGRARRSTKGTSSSYAASRTRTSARSGRSTRQVRCYTPGTRIPSSRERRVLSESPELSLSCRGTPEVFQENPSFPRTAGGALPRLEFI